MAILFDREARMTVFLGNGTARTFDYRAGDVGYVPLRRGIIFKIQVPKHYGF